jgi:hypothetical protein
MRKTSRNMTTKQILESLEAEPERFGTTRKNVLVANRILRGIEEEVVE